LEAAFSSAALEESRSLRSTDPQARALRNLVLLPVAEAQLTALMGEYIHHGGADDLEILDPQEIGLGPAVEAVSHTIEALCRLHDVGGIPQIVFAPGRSSASSLAYHAWPTAAVWETKAAPRRWTVAPTPIGQGQVEPLLRAQPRAVIADSSERRAEVRQGLLHLLRNLFGKVEFRDGQTGIIERVLGMEPAVGLLPAAAGKSLCYQLASFAQPGFTVVIEPLRSLMVDQQENLGLQGIGRSLAIVSTTEATAMDDRHLGLETFQAISRGEYWFVFIAPERLQMPDFRPHLGTFGARVPVALAVLDEAHCVSEWGHDFRTSYVNVGTVLRKHCGHDGRRPTLMALTSTASFNVLIDIARELELDELDLRASDLSFDRRVLQFEVSQVTAANRLSELVGRLRSLLAAAGWSSRDPLKVPSGLVFTSFVDDRGVGVSVLAQELSKQLGLPVGVFSGAQPVGTGSNRMVWEQQKLNIQQQYSRNEVPILACTEEYGIGMNKPDIRFIIHAMLPKSFEEFYQQAGRAGRDGQLAHCIVFFHDDQAAVPRRTVAPEKARLDEVFARAGRQRRSEPGDANRNLALLTGRFPGREVEKQWLRALLDGDIARNLPVHLHERVNLEIRFNALPSGLVEEPAMEAAVERTLYRLLLVGGIADFMKDDSGRKYLVELIRNKPEDIYEELTRYLRRYLTEGEVPPFLPKARASTLEDAIYECGSALIDYVYEKIEPRRHQAIEHILQAARDAARDGPERFRKALQACFQESEFAASVVELSTRANPDEWFEALGRVAGNDGVAGMLGVCRRQLEENPDHPGLLLLTGLCRTASRHFREGPSEVRLAFSRMSEIIPDELHRLATAKSALEHAKRLVPSRLDGLMDAILQGDASPAMVRDCYLSAETDGLAHHTAVMLLGRGILEHLAEQEGS
jgi:ATP-dependent DNA helicase RecQ